VLIASPAVAGEASHGYGYTWSGDGTSFIGSYRVNGYLAYCDSVSALPAAHFGYGNPDWTPSTGWSSTTKAKLAYLMREYGTSRNNTTAAAVSLNIWRLTGMNGHTDEYFAARADGSKTAVLAAANAQRTAMNGGATRAVMATTTIAIAPGVSTGTVSSTLQVDKLSGWATVAAGRHNGTMKLTGAVFADTGSATRAIRNGGSYPIRATVAAGQYRAGATVTFSKLPYGDTVGVMSSTTAGRQPLLVAGERDVAASASAAPAVGTVSIPFQLSIGTRASTEAAEPGTRLTDTLDVSVASTTANPAAEWPTKGVAPTQAPVPVTIRSRLWGPFDAVPIKAGVPPAGAKPVCEVSRVVTAAGTYRSESCAPTGRGYYVWTASVDPNDTAVADGRAQVIAVQSRFGETAETTLLPWQPAASTRASEDVVASGACVSDTITITGARPGGVLRVTSQLWGPFPNKPTVGAAVDPHTAPLLGSRSTTTTGNGEFTTGCLTIVKPGYYVWTYRSAASPTTLAFGSDRVFAAETTLIRWHPTATTVVSQGRAATDTCVFDTITIAGMQPGGTVDVVSEAWGPFEARPAAGSPIDTTTARLASSSTMRVTSDGALDTPCRTLKTPGYYVYTYRSAGSGAVASFSSSQVFTNETVSVHAPPAGLAFTGSSPIAAELGAAGLILAGIGALLGMAGGRRRRPSSSPTG
jgi:hypothetical protein